MKVVLTKGDRGDYSERVGITQEPLLHHLDATKVIPALHGWIRFLCFFETLAYHVNSSHAFEDGIPIWGAGKGHFH
jgi:hypothetical protein